MDELVLDGIFRFHDTLAGASPLQRVGKAMIGLRTYDEIDRRDAAENFVALRLGHAAGDADQHLAALERLGLFQFAQATELGIDLLRSLFADMTGVEQDEIGVFRTSVAT